MARTIRVHLTGRHAGDIACAGAARAECLFGDVEGGGLVALNAQGGNAGEGCADGYEAFGGNVVLVVVDSLRADHLGLYGYDRPTSPFLDGFASDAVVFDRAWAPSSYTSQSMAAILTGRLPTSGGSIGLLERASGTLFSGDAIYDGALLDELPESDVTAYVATMKRLRELDVNVVHAGHEPSFGRDRLVELVDAYLAHRG